MNWTDIIPIAVYSVPPLVSGVVFMGWLLRIWYRTRERICVWLVAGIGLIPTIYWCFATYNWLYTGLVGNPTPLFNFVVSIGWFVLTCMEVGCVVMAVWIMSSPLPPHPRDHSDGIA